MKKTFLIVFLLINIQLHAQPWLNNTTGQQLTFFEMQQAFESYWKNNANPGGAGYNVFKRWEWFWEQRVGQSGQFPAPGHDFFEYQRFKSRNYRAYDFDNQKWRSVGPSKTPSGYYGLGRINCMAFHPTNKNIFWVGTPAGGIWKTTDFGQTWSTTSDKNPVLGVSSIVVHPTNPDTLYIATGDGDRGSLSGMTGGPRGDTKSIGILMSSDGGNTWKNTGMNWAISEAKLIRKIIMHPTQPWVLTFASSDGIYQSTDGGNNWSKTETGYFIDLAYKPNNPNVVYATTFSLSGNATVYRSTNGGKNFSEVYTIANGSRITLGVTPANASKLHLLVAHKQYGQLEGIYQSTDSGNNFNILYNTTNLLSNTYNASGDKGQGWYDLSYNILPNNENTIFVGGVNTWRSTNAGNSFELINMWTSHPSINPNGVQAVHADKHYFVTHPLDHSIIFDCNDGGIYYSDDMGNTFTDISEGLAITQFYKIAITDYDTSIILGGTQDNGTRVMYGNNNWYEATGGDGMECLIDESDPYLMYSTYAYGVIYQNSDGFQTNYTYRISDNIPAYNRGAWVTPICLEPGTSGVIYAGYKAVYKSTDMGFSWQAISDSLAQTNLLRNLVAANNKIIYAGDYYGIYRTLNGGLTWSKIVTSTVPISDIMVSPHNPKVIYYTHSSYSNFNKVFKYDGDATAGNQITNLSENLPNVSINCIAYEKTKNEGLYIGTDIGVFYRDSLLNEWVIMNGNLPNAVVTDIEINNTTKELYVATYGRGAWKTTTIPVLKTAIIGFNPEHKSNKNSPLLHNLIIYHNDTIQKGNGNIILYQNGSEFTTIPVQSSSVSISLGKNIVLSMPDAFDSYATINVSFTDGVFKDKANNNLPGIDSSDWRFQTDVAENVNFVSVSDYLVLYPNPATDILHLKLINNPSPISYEITDTNGKVLTNGTFLNTDNQIYLSNFSSGIYFLKCHKDGILTVAKIVIDK